MATEKEVAHQGRAVDGLEAENVISLKTKLDEDKYIQVDWRDVWDGATTHQTFASLPPQSVRKEKVMTDADRVRAITDAMRERAHEAELNAEWWSGVFCGVIVTIGAGILTLILRMWIG